MVSNVDGKRLARDFFSSATYYNDRKQRFLKLPIVENKNAVFSRELEEPGQVVAVVKL